MFLWRRFTTRFLLQREEHTTEVIRSLYAIAVTQGFMRREVTDGTDREQTTPDEGRGGLNLYGQSFRGTVRPSHAWKLDFKGEY